MTEYRVLSFLTDYGLADGFVAACHGVAMDRAAALRFIDISHEVPRGDIRRGAHVLAQTVPSLPLGVHIGVVDPGVGTTRHPIAIDTGAGVLVGPDNGLLTVAADALGGALRATTLTNSELHRHPTSRTFHGRDIFTPVAAAIATGTDWDELGDPVAIKELVRFPEPVVDVDDDGLRAEVLTIDRFGNVQLAAGGDRLDMFGDRLTVNGHPAQRADMFAAAGVGELVVLTDSAGQVAVAVNGGSAADLLRAVPGTTVRIESVG